MAHGYVTSWFLAPDELTHGADAYCEVLCQVLEQVCQLRSSKPLPRHLVLQGDNTVAQAKNGFVGAFCAYVVGKQIFQSVTMKFLMVRHTHNTQHGCWQTRQRRPTVFATSCSWI